MTVSRTFLVALGVEIVLLVACNVLIATVNAGQRADIRWLVSHCTLTNR